MPQTTEIKSEKILLKQLFNMWFQVPEYQRPYLWGYDQVHDLLDDFTFAMENKPEAEYFLGSLVFQAKPIDKNVGRNFEENDLLDGQQRLTTLLLLVAVLRDLTGDASLRKTCQEFIYQEADRYRRIPERLRMQFAIRERSRDFFEQFVKQLNGTKETDALKQFVAREQDTSVQNMANTVRVIRDYFSSHDRNWLGGFLEFLLNKVMLIYVSTEDLEDAFRLFTILNNRGLPLRNSDILKSINLGSVESEVEKRKFARMWEEAESELGEDFDRFLAYLRTILVKDKARLSLLKEFEDKIYDPKEKDKDTGRPKPVLLQKGKDTFQLIEKYLEHYNQLFSGSNHDALGNFEFDNLIQVMTTGLPSTDWIPPLLAYYQTFGNARLLEFLRALNAKFAGDWIGQKTPTDRIEAMNDVIKAVESASSPEAVLASNVVAFEPKALLSAAEGDVYGKRFALYLLLLLDFVYQNHDQKMHFETLSVEHILPQNPSEVSEWIRLFDDSERATLTNKIGNLVLITRRKNSSQGRLDYKEKKSRYFDKMIDTCPNSLRVLNKYADWTPTTLGENQDACIAALKRVLDLRS